MRARHISQELMDACYSVVEHGNNAIFACRDLENCKLAGIDPCAEMRRALGACGLVIESCQRFIEHARLHLDQCDIPECSQRVKDALKACDASITQCQECLRDCENDTGGCAYFSQQAARTCEEVVVMVENIIKHL